MTDNMTERTHEEPKQAKREPDNPKGLFAILILLLLLSNVFFGEYAAAETIDNDDNWYNDLTIMEDPAYFMTEEEEEDPIPVISSVGKKNVKVNGVKSKKKLIQYTVPEELLRADNTFLRIMLEAEKYIGYPYVYGESNPKRGFDCSGFVCWVYIQSGVYNTHRLGANGLHNRCTEVDEDGLRPGDLVFFEGTMGRDVKGITHVGIYVGNHMMIHAGDPVGFADLCSDKWKDKIACYGRLPIE